MKKSLIVTKKHIVLSVLVFALAAAVYLNWQFARPNVNADNEGTASYLGAAEYVNGTVQDEEKSENSKYFEDTKKNREDSRKEKLKILDEVISNTKSTKEEVSSATNEKNLVSKYIEYETNIESLIKAKGFSDCVAIISDSKATVVVASKGLLASQTIQIQDIVSSQTGFSLENIKIIEIN